MEDRSVADTPELETISPIVAGAAGNNVHQAKVAGTPQTKQGVAGITSTNVKGNVHEVPKSSPSVWNAPKVQTATKPTEQVAEQGITDLDRTKLVTESRKQSAEDKRVAQESLNTSASLQQLGSVGESIKRVLQGNINKIFDDKDTRLQGEGLAAIGGSQELMSQMAEGLGNKTTYTYKDGAGKDVTLTGADALSKIFGNISEADTILDGFEGKVKTGGVLSAEDTAGQEAATVKMNEAITALANSLGDADGKLDFTTISSVIPDTNKLMGLLAASSLADKVVVNDDLLGQMFTAEGEAAPDQAEIDKVKGLLGLTGSESVTELRTKIDNYMATEFKDVTDLEDTLRDPLASPDEKREALEQLRDKGYTGAMASRDAITEASDTIQEFDEGPISFLGNDYASLSDALSDESIMGAVSDYLDGKLDADKIPAPLRELIDSNREVFGAAVTEMEKEVGDFNTRQDQWKEIASIFPPDQAGSKEILNLLGYKPGQPYQTAVLNPKDFPALKAIVDKSEPAATQAKSFIKGLQAQGVNQATMQAVLKGLDSNEVATLSSDAGLMKEYIDSAAFTNKIASIQAGVDKDGNGKVDGFDILGQLFGDTSKGSIADLQAAMADYDLLKDALPPEMRTNVEKAFTFLDSVSALNNPTDMMAALSKLTQGFNLDDVGKFKDSVSAGDAASSLASIMNSVTSAFGGPASNMRAYAGAVRNFNSGAMDVDSFIAQGEKTNMIGDVSSPDSSSNANNLAGISERLSKLGVSPANIAAIQGKMLDRVMQPTTTLTNVDGQYTKGTDNANVKAFNQTYATIAQAAAKGVPGASAKMAELVNSTVSKRTDYGWDGILGFSKDFIKPTVVGGKNVWPDLSNVAKKFSTKEQEELGFYEGTGDNAGKFFMKPIKDSSGYRGRAQTLLASYRTYADMTGRAADPAGFEMYVTQLMAANGGKLPF